MGLCKQDFPLNEIRRSLKLNFPFNKSNVTEELVLKIHCYLEKAVNTASGDQKTPLGKLNH